jgi:hypothetical protein
MVRGMNLDEPVWDVTVFTKNRNRLLEGDVALRAGGPRHRGAQPSAYLRDRFFLSAAFEMFHFIRAIRCEIRTPVANLRAGVASARRIGQLDLNRAPFGRWRSVWQIEVQRVSLTNARERVLERRSLGQQACCQPPDWFAIWEVPADCVRSCGSISLSTWRRW